MPYLFTLAMLALLTAWAWYLARPPRLPAPPPPRRHDDRWYRQLMADPFDLAVVDQPQQLRFRYRSRER
jgi:hypothetical protein